MKKSNFKNREYHQNRPKINIELIVSLAVIMVTTLGATVPLYVYTATQTSIQMQSIHEEIKAIHQEMKDFHGRLCQIEERTRK